MRVGRLEAPLHLLQQLPDFVIQPLREFGGQLWRENPPRVKATPAGEWASTHGAQTAFVTTQLTLLHTAAAHPHGRLAPAPLTRPAASK